MGITVKREFTVDVNGQTVTFNPEVNKITEQRFVSFVCDSPRCAARHQDKSTFLSWEEESAKNDPRTLPIGFESVSGVRPDPFRPEYEVWFCSPQCGKDFFQYAYVRPKTVTQRLAEETEKLEVNAEAQQAIDGQNPQMFLKFDESAEEAFLDSVIPVDSDATGYKEE